MQKGINLASHDFKNNVIGLINDSGLPPILIQYILKDLIDKIKETTEQIIQEEYKKFQSDLDEENKKRLAQNKKIRGEEKDKKCQNIQKI